MLNKFLNKLDQFFLEINDYWEDKKRKIKFWFVDKVQTIEKFSNPTKVILASLISFCIYRYFTEQALGKETSNAYWTLATLFISSPVAFIIWHFRDKNITQQIENQRKDINLKEFQKIAEWVSGLHLVEDEVTEQFKNSARKRIIKTQRSSNQKETTRKYPQQSEHLSIPTFSKKDGAVGLQIAAIYNLLPFYRGEHGESFKKPALNLLLSAWLALQQKEVKNLENFDVLTNRLDFDNTVKKIQENGRSPIGIAITHVLLADGGGHLVQYPEVFPNLCLAGMDFHLPGLDKNVLSLFINIKNCSGINLIAANLHSARLDGASLYGARLDGASLMRARLDGASLMRARLDGARLGGARLYGARLYGAIFTYNTDSDINWADLKSKGGVILYFTTSERKRDIRMQLVKAEAKFFHYVLDNIDIEKTQQENPDWKIFIIK
ncbi:pentapeptide repeat-containing protein [Pasteurella multocida]|uniref:pentapeptide repeat-containing protein n=1 Tax=Pasteurella multocida TaxID=747 RepID=UPI00286B6C23|nr:pentapeptide repeat-containing protein [Pasteurella multocida]WMY63654.1 pentapeptide repeat-containing protein [Pasteurella multocida]